MIQPKESRFAWAVVTSSRVTQSSLSFSFQTQWQLASSSTRGTDRVAFSLGVIFLDVNDSEERALFSDSRALRLSKGYKVVEGIAS